MLPLDTVTRDNVLAHTERLVCNLRALRAAGVDGVMVDVWWGVVESAGPRQYDWSAYHALFCHISAAGLKIQAVMSFHQCGGNTGDSCFVPLPQWVLDEGDRCPDIFFTNRDGLRNREYLSFGVDDEPVLAGRTGVQCNGNGNRIGIGNANANANANDSMFTLTIPCRSLVFRETIPPHNCQVRLHS
ncbi:unnamed protein product [Closterium sp. NIES-54]